MSVVSLGLPRLLHDAGLSSTAQNQALESVNSQLQQVQSFLTSEREVTAALRVSKHGGLDNCRGWFTLGVLYVYIYNGRPCPL